jgi:hypothetical protein
MKKTKLLIVQLAICALTRNRSVAPSKLNQQRKEADLTSLGTAASQVKMQMPGQVIAEIWSRATHIGPILQGILNEPHDHTEPRLALRGINEMRCEKSGSLFM